jgi:hypothetical protein
MPSSAKVTTIGLAKGVDARLEAIIAKAGTAALQNFLKELMPLAQDLIQVGFSYHQADWLGDTVDAAVAATGTDQASAKLLTATVNVVTSLDGTNYCLRLPPAASFKGPYLWVRNLVATSGPPSYINVYCAVGEYIDSVLNGYKAYSIVTLTPTPQGAGILVKISDNAWVSFTGT